MEIKLNKEDKKKIKQYTPLRNYKYKTKKEQAICEDYQSGMRMVDIMDKYNVSSGLVQSVVNTYGKLNRHKSTKVAKRVKHITSNPETLNNLIRDYQFMKNADIYEKYNIHKNGLYYILDTYKVPRKTFDKEMILEDKKVLEDSIRI